MYNILKQEIEIMVIEIDFNSDEAIYVQLMNQIIFGIATSRLQEGDQLPSVRQMADTIGINMHTVNKAYSLLRQEESDDCSCQRMLQKYNKSRST